MKFTEAQKAAHFETWQHIHQVRKLLTVVGNEIYNRALNHDLGKMETPEMEGFAHFTPMLKDLTYGSQEYKDTMKEMGGFVRHHQENNCHHPEYHKNGVNDMTLIDLLELLCDWKAATLRSKDGDIMKSFEINKERFGMSDQLVQILINTIKEIENK